MYRVLIGISAAVILALAAWLLLRAPDRLTILAADLPFEPPRLRVPSGRGLAAEEWTSLLLIDGDRREVRLSYEPEDGGPRVRELHADALIPWPKLLDDRRPGFVRRLFALRTPGWQFPDRPAVVLCADGDALWPGYGTPGDRLCPEWPRLYLAGRTDGGGLGAVPLHVDLPHAITRIPIPALGYDWIPRYVDLRVTRDGDRVRYRWGWNPVPPFPRRDELAGDVEFGEDDLDGDPAGSLLEGLAEALAMERRAGPVAWVALYPGEGVRYLDVLRAVECGRGDPRVLFLLTPFCSSGAVLAFRLPRVPDRETLALPEFDGVEEKRVILNVQVDGRTILKGRPATKEEVWRHFLVNDRVYILLRADQRSPFRACLEWIRFAREHGHPVRLAFGVDDPGFGWERALLLPPPCEGGVRFEVSDEITAGEMWQEVLSAVRDGATGIAFE